ncbi:transglycosylase domain-containing protein [Sphingomonas sp. ASY06-1R]|uniref:transglycosylase domain-containing protein n=1 Tax=Sphingomonas sp. ASY06-1R TaxID=3445771 RepID=UPI003FA2C092
MRQRLPITHLPGWRQVAKWSGGACLALLLVAVAWATWVAPPWGSMQPAGKPTFIFLSADGTPIARRGGQDAPVDAAKLPLQVRGAFIAIEDRRFATHHGVDLRGLLRATWRNARAGGVVEGGSTITQQLAKIAFLSSDRKIGRKVQELVLAVWLDAWLSKDEILSRYLSSIYFGDGAYGLRAAARHYFQKAPEDLSLAQAAMLAGMVKAPSRLSPTNDLRAAQARSRLVLAAMSEEGMVKPAKLAGIRLAVPRVADDELPGGTYFVDWIAPQVEAGAKQEAGQVQVRTTLERGLQKAAITALTGVLNSQGSALHATQAAIVVMQPDGRVVAMVGGRSHQSSPFNRATQARRQPGSAFKLAVYLAAMEHGYSPDSMVENSPLTIDQWTPRNYGNRYGPPLRLRDAFAQSSNVAAVRIAEQVGRGQVTAAARQLGIESPIASGPSMALGTSGTTLLELTSAYASIASGTFPVKPRGLADQTAAASAASPRRFDPRTREAMLDLLWTATNQGTGHAAALSIPTFGKTGTTQNHRDALFVGFAGGLITGVWVGNDNNTPMRGVTGGSLPAQIWRRFMSQANLRESDLPLPAGLQQAIAERQEAMRAAAAEREAAALEAAEDEELSPLERFFEPLIPRFLRGDSDRRRRYDPEDRDYRREDERRYREPSYDEW